MKYLIHTLHAFLLFALLDTQASSQIIEVDFLKASGLAVNGAGPLLVRADTIRNRIFLVNTFTSSVSVIDGETRSAVNIPVKNRVPQFLKEAAVSIDRKTGHAYVIGTRSLHIVMPESQAAVSFDTEKQFEMVAVNSRTGDAFLVGRESRFLARVDRRTGRIKKISCFDREEPTVNLNATPPPSIRKVVCDSLLDRVYVIDGYTSTFFVFSAGTGKLLNKRPLLLEPGERWHFAGFNEKSHSIYIVVETKERKVIQAARINAFSGSDRIISLPGLTEGAGIAYDPVSDAVLVPYDNHPVLHLVSFRDSSVQSIGLPGLGNDASAIDAKKGLFYVASWAYGEIDVVDLKALALRYRHRDKGVLPHMFSMAMNPRTEKLYIPLGATAVNGSHGAALTVLDLPEFRPEKIHTGWSPVDLVQVPGQEHFLVFNSEDGFAEVYPDGRAVFHTLPITYPRSVVQTDNGNLLLTYGPHQSCWPVVYIWAARNGVLEIEPRKIETAAPEKWNYSYFDTRIARLAQGMVRDKDGGLYLLQNNWGEENLFLGVFPEGIRVFASQERMSFDEKVLRETTQRILEYDPEKDRLYAVRTGETNDATGRLMVIDPKNRLCVASMETGITPTDLVFDGDHIFVSNFDDNAVSRFDKNRFSGAVIPCGRGPLRMAVSEGRLYVINHLDNTLEIPGDPRDIFPLPAEGRPDNLFLSGNTLVIASHSPSKLSVVGFDVKSRTFHKILESDYPFGDTSYDQDNTAFFVRGQFGDALFDITLIREDHSGHLWIADYLSGRLFIVDRSAWSLLE